MRIQMKNYQKLEQKYDLPEFQKMYEALCLEILPDQALDIVDNFMNRYHEEVEGIRVSKACCHNVIETIFTKRKGWSHFTEFTGEPATKEEQVHTAYIFLQYSIERHGVIETFEVRGGVDLEDGLVITTSMLDLLDRSVRISVIPLSDAAHVVSKDSKSAKKAEEIA